MSHSPNGSDPASVASPSEGQRSPTPLDGERTIRRGESNGNGTSDDAISVGEITQGGSGKVARESQPQGRDERKVKVGWGEEGELETRLGKALDRSEYLQEELNHQRSQSRYWRDMYRIMLRILSEQHDDPALAWLDEITHDRFALLLSERKL